MNAESRQEGPTCGSSRRDFNAMVLAASLVPIFPTAIAQTSSSTRPHAGQRLAIATGERAGQELKPVDLKVGEDPMLAYPMEPGGTAIQARTMMLAVIRIPEHLLSAQVRPHAPQGIVAYSAICTHYGCPVTKTDANSALVCNCHGSAFDAGNRGVVVKGPATRRLPMLPLVLTNGSLAINGSFDGPIGPPT